MMKKELKGHSGCKLEIQEDQNNIFVVKTSKNIEYNKRLKAQCEKQKKYRGVFKTPKVFYFKNSDAQSAFFSMEYINGLKLSDYLAVSSAESLRDIAEKIKTLISVENSYDINAKDVILLKIEDLKKIIPSKNSIILTSIKKLEDFNWQYCVKSECHGDLTFENIIFKDGEFYLIDFLDSFYDSWLIDIAKIFQDLDCGWSYRDYKEIDENLRARLLTLKEIIINYIFSINNGRNILITIYHFLLLNLLRILPYTKDKNIRKYLYKEIKKINNIIKKI